MRGWDALPRSVERIVVLRDNPQMAQEYLAEKERLANLHAMDSSTGRYAKDKERWFAEVAEPAMQEWMRRVHWQPDSAAG